jgi:two-component system response regulator TctD
VLALGLPDADGLTLLDQMRRRRDQTPVLILSARGGLDDRVGGLNKGASDYMVKPFSADELIARLQALLRRSPGPDGPTLTLGNVALKTEGRMIEVYVHRLRKILAEAGANVQIHTIRGAGYLMDVAKSG